MNVWLDSDESDSGALVFNCSGSLNKGAPRFRGSLNEADGASAEEDAGAVCLRVDFEARISVRASVTFHQGGESEPAFWSVQSGSGPFDVFNVSRWEVYEKEAAGLLCLPATLPPDTHCAFAAALARGPIPRAPGIAQPLSREVWLDGDQPPPAQALCTGRLDVGAPMFAAYLAEDSTDGSCVQVRFSS